MTKPVLERSVLVHLKRHLKKIGHERDALRELQSEVEQHIESATRGYEALDEAIQALSEYV